MRQPLGLISAQNLAARLQSVRENQAQRLSVDTHAAREARLQSVRDTEVVCGDSCC